MITTKLSPKGRATIPADIRRRLGLKGGEKLAIEERNGEVVLTPLKLHFHRLAGVLKGGGSLTEELLKERARDREREDAV